MNEQRVIEHIESMIKMLNSIISDEVDKQEVIIMLLSIIGIIHSEHKGE